MSLDINLLIGIGSLFFTGLTSLLMSLLNHNLKKYVEKLEKLESQQINLNTLTAIMQQQLNLSVNDITKAAEKIVTMRDEINSLSNKINLLETKFDLTNDEKHSK